MNTYFIKLKMPMILIMGICVYILNTITPLGASTNESVRYYIISIPLRKAISNESQILLWHGSEEYWLKRQEIFGDETPDSLTSNYVDQYFSTKHSGVLIAAPLKLENGNPYIDHLQIKNALKEYVKHKRILGNQPWYEIKYVNQSKPTDLPIITFLKEPLYHKLSESCYSFGYSTALPVPLNSDEFNFHSYYHTRFGLKPENTLLDLDYTIRVGELTPKVGQVLGWKPCNVQIEPPIETQLLNQIDKLYFTRFDEAGNAFIQKDPIDDRNENVPAYPRPNASDTENETQIEGLNSDNWWYRQHELGSSEWQQKNSNLNYKDYIVRSYIYGEYPFQPKEDKWFGYWKKSYPGWVFDQFWPWVWTDHLGWVYTYGFDASSIWLYSTEMQFLWTSETAYPWVYSDNLSKWLYVGFKEGGLRTGDTVLFDPKNGDIHFILNKPE